MRKIIHVDMDCFYAAIEQRDDPSLAGLPVAVGGRPNSRGVVSTCNYVARRYGVRSAMPAAHAAKLCPDLVFVKTNMAKYKAESKNIREIFHRYTDLVQPMSLDEAFLDTTDSSHCHGSATWIAQSICRDIYEETQLTASAGVATNKFLAKVASDWNKPAGLKVVLPEEAQAFIDQLSVSKLPGVGKVMTAKLENMDIFTGKELRQLPLDMLLKKFGKMGKYLYDLSRGIDDRKVKTSSARKSLSVETTFFENLEHWDDCETALHKLISSLSRRLAKAGDADKIRKVYVKVKDHQFKIHTAESISIGLDIKLLLALFKRLRKQYPQPIRLLGIGVRFPEQPKMKGFHQLDIPF